MSEDMADHLMTIIKNQLSIAIFLSCFHTPDYLKQPDNKCLFWLSIVALRCNSNIQKLKAGWSWVWCQIQSYSKDQDSLGCIAKLSLNKSIKKTNLYVFRHYILN